jgi:glycerol-3-phosphate dehydrogenase
VVARLAAAGDRRTLPASRTGDVPLPGGRKTPEEVAATALSVDGHGLPAVVIGHLAGRYGSRLSEVLEVLARDERLAAPILPELLDRRAEVVAAVEQEWALTLEDVLRRRTRVALEDAAAGAGAAAEVATLMAARLGWSSEETRTAVVRYVEAIASAQRWR